MNRLKKALSQLAALATIAFIATSGFSLAGCNTVEGVGRDIEGAGDAIEDAAD